MHNSTDKRRERLKKRKWSGWVYLKDRRVFRMLIFLGRMAVPLVQMLIELLQLFRG
jgi:hypothetical protein